MTRIYIYRGRFVKIDGLHLSYWNDVEWRQTSNALTEDILKYGRLIGCNYKERRST